MQQGIYVAHGVDLLIQCCSFRISVMDCVSRRGNYVRGSSGHSWELRKRNIDFFLHGLCCVVNSEITSLRMYVLKILAITSRAIIHFNVHWKTVRKKEKETLNYTPRECLLMRTSGNVSLRLNLEDIQNVVHEI